MHATLRHIEGKGVGYDTGYTTVEAFFAPDTEDRALFPFVDLRGHLFDNGKFAANAGLGVRQMVGNRVYGGNLYYDYRNTRRSHYNQIGVGFESLGRLWDLRINGYVPVGDKKSRGYHSRFDEFSGHHLYMKRKYEFAMTGLDAEVGFHFGKTKNFDFYGALSPYYFSGQLGSAATGARARLVGHWKRMVSVELSDSYDTVFKNNFQGQLAITISFGPRTKINPTKPQSCKSWMTLKDRLVQPVSRDEIIVVNTHRKRKIAIDPLTGQPYYFLFVNNNSHSLGTFESPYPTLLEAQQASSPYDIIYIFPGDNTTTGLDQGMTLKDNQQLLGAPASYVFPTTKGHIKVPALAATYPVLTNTKGSVISLASNNVIAGLYIQNSIGSGLAQSDSSKIVYNLKVIGNIFQGLGGSALNLNNVGGFVEIYNNKFNVNVSKNTQLGASTSGGVFISNSLPMQNSRYRIMNNTFAGTGIAYSLQDMSGFSTQILNNSFLTSLASIQINMSNTIAAIANTFEIQGNTIYSSQTNIQVALASFANGIFNVLNNQAFAATGSRLGSLAATQNANAVFNLNDNAQSQLNMKGNIFKGAGGCLAFNNSSASNITSTISNNDFVGGGNSALQISNFSTTSTALFTCTISENSLVDAQGLSGVNIQVDQNSMSEFVIADNILNGLNIQSFTNAQVAASISNNKFPLCEETKGAGALNLTTNAQSQANWSVVSNTFTGSQGNAANISANDTSSLALIFDDNSATPIEAFATKGTYNFENNSTGIFDVVSTVGNFGKFYGNVPVSPMEQRLRIQGTSGRNLKVLNDLLDQIVPTTWSNTQHPQ